MILSAPFVPIPGAPGNEYLPGRVDDNTYRHMNLGHLSAVLRIDLYIIVGKIRRPYRRLSFAPL